MGEYLLDLGSGTQSASSYMFRFLNTQDGDWYRIRAAIPKYARIESAIYHVKLKQNIAVTNGDFKAGMWSSADSSGEPETVLINNPESVTTSYKIWNINFTPYINSQNANAGEMAHQYAKYGFWVGSTLTRMYTWSERYYKILYTNPSLTINLAAGEGGTVTGGGTYNIGVVDSTAAISAAPQAGYHFVSWSDGNTSAQRSITISQNSISAFSNTLNLTAHFAADSINNIYVAGSKPSAIYAGTAKVKAVYKGTVKIYG